MMGVLIRIGVAIVIIAVIAGAVIVGNHYEMAQAFFVGACFSLAVYLLADAIVCSFPQRLKNVTGQAQSCGEPARVKELVRCISPWIYSEGPPPEKLNRLFLDWLENDKLATMAEILAAEKGA